MSLLWTRGRHWLTFTLDPLAALLSSPLPFCSAALWLISDKTEEASSCGTLLK